MNIFYLDPHPVLCAAYHNDSHVCKMILETAQLLGETRAVHGLATPCQSPRHQNHPCRKWTGLNQSNYLWLKELGHCLCNEYTFRWGKIHKWQNHFHLFDDLGVDFLPEGEFTPPPLAMPVELHQENHVLAYRAYYQEKKNHLAQWTKRGIPSWYQVNAKTNEVKP